MWGGTRRRRGRGNCGRDVIERRINNNNNIIVIIITILSVRTHRWILNTMKNHGRGLSENWRKCWV